MKFAAFVLIGMATVSTATAQSGPARVAFLPIPDKLPALLFQSDPLAGTLLKPLIEPVPNAFAEIAPQPVAMAAVSGEAVPEEPVPPPAAAPPPPVAEPPPAMEPAPAEAVQEPAVAPPPSEAAKPAKIAPPVPANAAESTVTVIVENVETSSGNVNVAICDKGLSREGCPYIREVPAQQGFVQTEFHDIPPGNYAVVGYHDVNGNNQFDKMMGIPREPYALSNHAGDKLVPTFADAELPIKQGENAVIIRLKRLGG